MTTIAQKRQHEDFVIVKGDRIDKYLYTKMAQPFHYEINLVEKASFFWISRGKRHDYHGCFYWVNLPGQQYRYGPIEKETGWRHRYMVVHGERVNLWHQLELFRDEPIEISEAYFQHLTHHFDEALYYSQNPNPVSLLNCANHLEALLIKSHRYLQKSTEHPPWISAIIQLLEKSPSNSPKYESIAQDVGVSLRTLQRVFKRCTGLSIHQYHLRIKVELCKSRLCHEPTSLSILAREVGFSDEAHLSKVFKKITGMTPGHFQQQMSKDHYRHEV